MTVTDSAFWSIQLYRHFERFYPEWVREINNNTPSSKPLKNGVYYYKTRPTLAQDTFLKVLKKSSVDQAMDAGLEQLTIDLPNPIFPEIIRLLNEHDIQVSEESSLLDICDKIRTAYPQELDKSFPLTIEIIQQFIN